LTISIKAPRNFSKIGLVEFHHSLEIAFFEKRNVRQVEATAKRTVIAAFYDFLVVPKMIPITMSFLRIDDFSRIPP
jgi:hypothetical protein